ncbi:MAG: protein kinase domain-containing protein [Lentisphaeria bacterium]
MKLCPHCHTEFDAATQACPTCSTDAHRPGQTSIMPADASVWSKLMPSVEVESGVYEPPNLVVKRHVVAGAGESAPDEADFELLDILGEGGMGIVYQARQTSVDRTIALKMIRPDKAERSDIKARLLAEAAVTGDLNHPNIVPIYDVGETESGAFFYAMKDVRGVPWTRDLTGKSLKQNIEILLRVADALAFAHSRGVIHRDLKPGNVMLGDYGEVLVMDWGMAMTVGDGGKAEPVTSRSSVGGTPAYMAPEMAMADRERIGVGTDIYLLGAVLYELISGRPPHMGRTVNEMMDAAARNHIEPIEPQTELVDIAMNAMADDPADRFESVKQFQTALRTYLSHSESIALSEQAMRDLTTAHQTSDYNDYAQALFGFKEALSLWDGNHPASEGEIVTRVDYATTALEKDDLDLAGSLLQKTPEYQPLHDRVTAARKQRLAQHKRQRLLANTVRGLFLLVLLTLTVAVISIRSEKEKAEIAQLSEKTQRQRVEEEKIRVDAALVLVKEQRAQAVNARQEAEVSLHRAEKASRRAEEQTLQALQAKAQAEEEKQRSERLRQQAEGMQQQLAAEAQKAEIARQDANAEKLILQALLERVQQQEQQNEETESALKRQTEIAAQAEQRVKLAERHQEKLKYITRITAINKEIGSFNLSAARAELMKCPVQHRNYEWGRLLYLCNPEATVLRAHKAQVNSVAFVDGGSRIVSGGSDRQAILWNIENGKPLTFLQCAAELRYVDRHHDSGGLILATSNGSVAERAANGTKQVLRKAVPGAIAVCTALSPDRSIGVTGYRDGQVDVWLIRNGELLRRLKVHPGGVTAVVFAPSERLFATAGQDGSVQIWRVDSPPTIALEVDIDKVAAPDRDGSLSSRLWVPNIEVEETTKVTIQPVIEPVGRLEHSTAVQAVSFAPGRRQLLTASGGTIQAWDILSQELLHTYEHRNEVTAAAYFPDGNRFASATAAGTVHIWRTDTAQETLVMRGHAGAIRDLTVSPDGAKVATAGADNTVRLWDILAYRRLLILEQQSAAVLASTALDDRLMTGSRDGSIQIWQRNDGTLLHTLHGHQQPVCDLALTGDGFASISSDGKLNVWDHSGMNLRTAQRQPIAAQDQPGNDLQKPVYSPDTSLYVHTAEPHVGLLSLTATRKPYAFFRGHAASITCAAFSPDGSRVITGCRDETAKLWDVQTGLELLTFDGHGAAVTHAKFTPDGGTVITGTEDGRAFVWKAEKWTE